MNYKEVFKLGREIKGSYVELGFGSGHSAKIMVELINAKEVSNRPIWIFDSFKGLPTPSEKDLLFDSSLTKAKYSKPIQPALDLRFDVPKTSYKVIKGYIEETLDQFIDEHISVLNVDLTTYTSTKVALETLHKFVPRNGVVLVPAYVMSEGVKTAVDEFLSKNNLTHQNKGTGCFINTLAKQFVTPKIEKDTSFKEQRLPDNTETKPLPYQDRYTKKTPKKLKYRKAIKEGGTVINNKVTR